MNYRLILGEDALDTLLTALYLEKDRYRDCPEHLERLNKLQEEVRKAKPIGKATK